MESKSPHSDWRLNRGEYVFIRINHGHMQIASFVNYTVAGDFEWVMLQLNNTRLAYRVDRLTYWSRTMVINQSIVSEYYERRFDNGED
jgi:hypothetical protein